MTNGNMVCVTLATYFLAGW